MEEKKVEEEKKETSGVDQHISNMSGENPDNSKEIESVDPEKAEIDFGLSAVAQNPKKNMIAMVIIVVVVGALAYYFFFSGSGKTNNDGVNNISIPKSASNNVTTTVAAPTIPNSQIAPAPVSPTPPAPSQNSNNSESTTTNSTTNTSSDASANSEPSKPTTTQDSQDASPPQPATPSFQQQSLEQQQRVSAMQKQQALAKRNQERITSNIMVQSGSSGSSSGGASGNGASGSNNNTASILASNGKFSPQQTSATQQQITKVGNMSNLVAQGKLIDAVLESSIVSTYPGPIRAVVSRDVYSEKGDNILIPKGSRLIGTFNSGYSAGSSRIQIAWNRIIMPNGFDIAVGSPSVGPEGITGVEGDLHTEFMKTLANAALVSTINIAFAKAAQSLTNTKATQTTTTTATDGSQTTTSVNDPTRDAINSSVSNLGNTLENYVNQNFVAKPFISVKHGTRIRVFVNKDILFPGNAVNGVNFVQ